MHANVCIELRVCVCVISVAHRESKLRQNFTVNIWKCGNLLQFRMHFARRAPIDRIVMNRHLGGGHLGGAVGRGKVRLVLGAPMRRGEQG